MSIMQNGKPDRAERKQQPKELKFDRMRGDLQADLLSEAEKEELRAQAREDFLAERKKQQADAVYRDFLEQERRAGDPKFELVPIFLQLPGSALYIMLDGKQYFTDTTYNEVPLPVAAVLIEQMNRMWAHEEITEVRDTRGRRKWRPPAGIGFGNYMDNRQPRNIVTTSAGMDGAIAAMQRTVQG